MSIIVHADLKETVSFAFRPKEVAAVIERVQPHVVLVSY